MCKTLIWVTAYRCMPVSVARQEMSLPARTLRSWVRIPLKAWMSVCVYSVFVLGSGLATGWSPIQGVLPTVLDQETEVKRSVSRMPYAPSGSNRERRREWGISWTHRRRRIHFSYGHSAIREDVFWCAMNVNLMLSQNRKLLLILWRVPVPDQSISQFKYRPVLSNYPCIFSHSHVHSLNR
jgi:hypothetical protein